MNSSGEIDHKTATVTGGTFIITSLPSVKVKAEGDGVYRGPLAWTFSGGSSTGFQSGTITGAGSILPTAIKVKADGSLVIRLEDDIEVTFAGTLTNGNPGTVVGSVEVSDAGQTKVKAL